MTLEEFLQKLKDEPESVTFADTRSVIDRYYHYTPVAFRNGGIQNAAGENSVSCMIFAFARLHELSEQQALNCFGDYYRKDVLENPGGTNHRNIRQFMQTGRAGIHFDGEALTPV